jgi:CheY-like chemotaxis protein
MAMGTVLAIDDEPLLLNLLDEFLTDADFEVVAVESGTEALALLDAAPNRFDVVLLDRMMPVMDGMEVLKAIRANPRLFGLPVVMQTAAAAPVQIQEGIAAGVFYYVTKPFEQDTLVAIVASAVAHCRQHRVFLENILVADIGLALLTHGGLHVRNLDEAKTAAALIGKLAAKAAPVMIGLLELISNAVEHGNLGLGWARKGELLRDGMWDQEIARLLHLPENQGKFVKIDFVRDADTVRVTISDQGEGFDWRHFTSLLPDRAFETHGRGIATARVLSFDDVNYRGKGNEVVVTFGAAPALV